MDVEVVAVLNRFQRGEIDNYFQGVARWNDIITRNPIDRKNLGILVEGNGIDRQISRAVIVNGQRQFDGIADYRRREKQ